MKRPLLQCAPQIRYTKEASRNRVSGDVIAKCTLDGDGTLCDCELVKSVEGMDQAIFDGLDTMRYAPLVYKGRIVRIRMAVRLHLHAPPERPERAGGK
jgi:TonB family protein